MIRMIINDTYKSAPSQKCNDGVEADHHQRRSWIPPSYEVHLQHEVDISDEWRWWWRLWRWFMMIDGADDNGGWLMIDEWRWSIYFLCIIYHHLSFICQLSSIYHLSFVYLSFMYNQSIIYVSIYVSIYILSIIYLSSFDYRLSLIYLSSNCHLTTIIYHLSVNKSIHLYI